MKLAHRVPRLESRLDALGALILEELSVSKPLSTRSMMVERAVMQIQVEWEHFVRGIILDSCTGAFSDSRGPVISANLVARSREAAAHKLVTLYPRRSFEPDWYLPDQAIDAAFRLGLTNFGTISAELGVTPWVIDDLRHLRNFIAHRSKRSALTIRNSGLLPSVGRSIDVLAVTIDYGRSGTMRFQEWIAFAKGVARRIVN